MEKFVDVSQSVELHLIYVELCTSVLTLRTIIVNFFSLPASSILPVVSIFHLLPPVLIILIQYTGWREPLADRYLLIDFICNYHIAVNESTTNAHCVTTQKYHNKSASDLVRL